MVRDVRVAFRGLAERHRVDEGYGDSPGLPLLTILMTPCNAQKTQLLFGFPINESLQGLPHPGSRIACPGRPKAAKPIIDSNSLIIKDTWLS